MSRESVTEPGSQPLLTRPANGIALVGMLAALVTAAVHLLLAPRVLSFNPTIATLFFLNGLGFVGGTLLFVSRYWRRELYLVAIVYALTTIVAFLALGGQPSEPAIAAKAAEAVVVLVAAYLYVTERPP